MKSKINQHNMQFGQAVHMRRTRLGMTLDQLASKSSVSAAALSRIERGLLSPSLRSAILIAHSLGCDLSELVKQEVPKITRAGENISIIDEKTGIERLTLARPTPEVEILSYTVPPHATSSYFAAHEPGTQEIFHIISGTLDIYKGEDHFHLQQGDTITMRMDKQHWFSNNGDQATQFILTILGH